MPSLSVVQIDAVRAQERRAGRLLAAEAERAVDQPGHEPLEPDRHLDQSACPSAGGDPVDHRGRHQRLADPRGVRPARAGAAEEVVDRDGQVVVGVHQPGVGRDDAVPVGVGVVAGGDVVLVLAPDQRGHRGRRRAVHPDLAVPVERHEAPGRVDQRVDHGQVEAVPLGDLAPVVDARAAQRVGADPHAGLADRVEVEHARQVVDVRRPGSRTTSRPRAPARTGSGVRPARPPAISSLARAAMTDGGVGVGRAAVRRVVLEAAVARRVVRRGDHDAVGQAGAGLPAAVGADDRVRDRRGRGVAVAGVDQHGHVVGGQHLERGRPGRLGQRVGVAADEQRPVVALLACGSRRSPGWSPAMCVSLNAVFRLRAAVPAGAERDLLVDVVRVGHAGVVRRDEVRRRRRGRRAGRAVPRGTLGHGPIMLGCAPGR